MSGTKSPFPKEPATKRQAIIVSHGQPSDPDPAEVELATLAMDVARLMPDWHVQSATLAKENALETALEQAGSAPLIYPLFMTHGWFTQTTLPKRVTSPDAKILAPLGVDQSLPALAERWLLAELKAQGWNAGDTCLIVAAHGSGRSENSSRDTRSFSNALSARLPFGEIRVGFIEEPPYLTDVVFDAGDKSICLPFFAAIRGHVTDDIPEALDGAEFAGLRLDPIGTHPDIPALIASELAAQFEHRAIA
jgi:sirohydrochlorin ferrochelatase